LVPGKQGGPSNPNKPHVSTVLASGVATGRGQLIDIALFESIFRVLDSLAITYSVTGKVRERMGTATALAAPHNHYPTRDGKWVAIACTNDRIFARLASVMEQGELTTDPRFLRERERVANRADIDRIVEAWTRSHDLAPLISALNQAEIPCSPINSIADIFQDQQFAARAALTTFQHPTLGEIKMPSIVPRLSETPGAIEWLGRGLGEDTSSVLGRALNYSAERLAELRNRGII
jgi:crotonobetainyl-CoA:carnitine CoA-transferase CaiB-like acyl-CoA transferase